MEKKSFMLSFEHDKDADAISESFGVSANDVATFTKECSDMEGKFSDIVLDKLETTKNAGGMLMALAVMCVARTVKEVRMEMIKKMLGGMQ